MEKENNQFVIQTQNLKIKINSKSSIINFSNISIPYGEFVLIEGNNGCGKSTFLKSLTKSENNYYEILEGAIFINGKDINSYDITSLRRSVVDISQEDKFLSYESTYEALRRSARIAVNYNNKKTDEIEQEIFKYYKNYLVYFFNDPTDIEKIQKYKNNPNLDKNFKWKTNVNKLSGGQQKFIHILQGIIKAKVSNCNLILMDEPLNNLDKENKKILIDLIIDLKKANPKLTILVITHCKVFPGVNAILSINQEQECIVASYNRLLQDAPYHKCLN